LFSGTLRFNIDTSGKVADTDIKILLVEAGLDHLLKRGCYSTSNGDENEHLS
jgi:hypothetical protein